MRRLPNVRWLVSAVHFLVRPSRPFSLLLLVAKVAQKPRTAFLAGAIGVKPKTNATRAKHLPSLFFHAFMPLARHDCTRQSLIRRQCKVRVCGAPSAQNLFVLIWLLNVRWLVVLFVRGPRTPLTSKMLATRLEGGPQCRIVDDFGKLRKKMYICCGLRDTHSFLMAFRLLAL